QERIRAQTLAALSPERLEQWQNDARARAQIILHHLPCGRTIDLVEQFAEPWSLSLALAATGAAPECAGKLYRLAAAISASAAEPFDANLKARAKKANSELARALGSSPIPMPGPAFVALSQTLPCFLANAWLALFRFPGECARMRTQPELLRSAVEELLRYAGIARMLFRQATAPVELCGLSMTQGDRAILMLCSANRDPARFAEPNRLDLARRQNPHVALGAAPHSCAGGALIRKASAVAMAAFAENFVPAYDDALIQWKGGSGFRSPKSLHALRRPGPGVGSF
ncbi:MAG: cytochrome P450, partial [Bryobacteraceae bacterium]